MTGVGQDELDRVALVEVDAMLHDSAYVVAEPVLKQLLLIAQADSPAASRPALRTRVVLQRLDQTGVDQLLADLLVAAVTALDEPPEPIEAALRLYAEVQRSVERAEIRLAAGSAAALEQRCARDDCIRDAWWQVATWQGGLVVTTAPACARHVRRVEDLLRPATRPSPDPAARTDLTALPGNPAHARYGKPLDCDRTAP